jgi:hypothetical protein
MKCRVQRSAKYWREELDYFDEGVLTVKSPNGKSRSFEENKLFILALHGTLQRRIKAIEAIEEKHFKPIEARLAIDRGRGSKGLPRRPRVHLKFDALLLKMAM